jgi:uncharacterized protein (DUF2141 family)
VHKAQQSEAAKKKAATKLTPDGFTVESFQDLLSNLGTIVMNWCRPKGIPIEPFTMTTTPTPYQHRIDLLGLTANYR